MLRCDRWYRRRKTTTLIGLLHQSLLYFDYGAISISALYYYQTEFPKDNPNRLYGITMFAYSVSLLISTPFVGSYVDKTRNIRRIVLTTLIFSVFGNLIYTMTFSKWLPVVGRFLCGLNDGARSSLLGELSRIYHKRDLRRIISRFQITGIIVSSIAPASPILFLGIHFNVATMWKITENNFIGIFLAMLSIILWIVCYFGLSNLTIDLDYELVKGDILKDNSEASDKETPYIGLTNETISDDYNSRQNATDPETCNEEKQDNNPETSVYIQKNEIADNNNNNKKNLISTPYHDNITNDFQLTTNSKEEITDSKPPNKPNAIWTTCDILKRVDVLFIILADGILSFQYYQLELLVNMTGVLHFQMTQTQLGITILIAVLFASFITVLIERKSGSDPVVIYYQYAFAFVFVMVEELILFGISGSNFSINIVSTLLGSTVFFNMVVGCFAGMCCRWILFAITPSHSASTVESHRYFVENLSSSLAFSTSGLVFTNLFVVMPFLIILSSAITFSLLIIRNGIFREIGNNDSNNTQKKQSN